MAPAESTQAEEERVALFIQYRGLASVVLTDRNGRVSQLDIEIFNRPKILNLSKRCS